MGYVGIFREHIAIVKKIDMINDILPRNEVVGEIVSFRQWIRV